MNYLANTQDNQAARSYLSIPLYSADNKYVFDLDWNPYCANINTLVIPFLRQLAKQPRWQLWLTDNHKLPRSWFEQSQLPTEHIIQATRMNNSNTVNSVLTALKSNNFSSIVLWQKHLSEQDKIILQAAASKSHTYIFIINKAYISYQH